MTAAKDESALLIGGHYSAPEAPFFKATWTAATTRISFKVTTSIRSLSAIEQVQQPPLNELHVVLTEFYFIAKFCRVGFEEYVQKTLFFCYYFRRKNLNGAVLL